MTLLGQRVGNIEIEALLGAGGMGEVYRGFDVRLERHVAVKTLRAQHRLDGEVKARFLREARILSRLESSAICQVFDLVEGDDADFLIFEYIEGQTLRQQLDRGCLEATRALELAEKITLALAVAHRERIIHRDLKPENVMVTAEGGVKILDFGISYAMGEAAGRLLDPLPASQGVPHPASGKDAPLELEDTEILTVAATVRQASAPPEVEAPSPELVNSGARLTRDGTVIGTLTYMSPEQATGQDLSEASDMFSFGLLLQEMLTGQGAYEPAPIRQLLPRVARGDTRAIDGSDIDPDAVRLIEDLVRLKPESRPSAESAAQRLRWVLDRPKRLLRQKRRNLLAVSAFVALLAVLTVVSVFAVRAEREARRAEQEAQRAESEARRANEQARRASQEAGHSREVADFLVELFEAATPENALGREVGVQEILRRGSERIDRELQAQPLVRARLKDTLGAIHWRLGEFQEAERLLTAALEIRREHLPEGDAERARSKQQLAALLADQGRLDLAEPLLRDAVRALEAAGSEEAPDLAGVLNDLAALTFERGDFNEAEALYQRSLELTQQAHGKRSVTVAYSLNNLAVLAWQLGDYARAEDLYERSLSIHEEHLGENHPDIAALLNNLGILHREMNELETAQAFHERALTIAEQTLGGDHPEVAAILYSLGRLLVLRERLEEAVPLFERAYAIRAEVLGPESYEVGRTLASLGDLLRSRGELQRSRSMLRRARRLLSRALGDDHLWTLEATHALANLYRDAGDKEQAKALYSQALATATDLLGADHPQIETIRHHQRRLDDEPPPAQ